MVLNLARLGSYRGSISFGSARFSEIGPSRLETGLVLPEAWLDHPSAPSLNLPFQGYRTSIVVNSITIGGGETRKVIRFVTRHDAQLY